TDLLQALKEERLSSVFSPDGTLISASAAPHCGVMACDMPEPSKWMDNIKEWIFPAQARAAHKGVLQKRLEEGLC
ncbi:hypothetical protein, partial [Thiolapillus sp.]|uniref:hypothetical protein n=1 Tax=Thiolapillus sp. TaxID=2017437 RepID=UPI003AF9A725